MQFDCQEVPTVEDNCEVFGIDTEVHEDEISDSQLERLQRWNNLYIIPSYSVGKTVTHIAILG